MWNKLKPIFLLSSQFWQGASARWTRVLTAGAFGFSLLDVGVPVLLRLFMRLPKAPRSATVQIHRRDRL